MVAALNPGRFAPLSWCCGPSASPALLKMYVFMNYSTCQIFVFSYLFPCGPCWVCSSLGCRARVHTLGGLKPPPGDLPSLGTHTLASLSCRAHLRRCCVHVYNFEDGSGEGLSKNLTLLQQWVQVQRRQGCGRDGSEGHSLGQRARDRRTRAGAGALELGQRDKERWTGQMDRGWSRGIEGWVKRMDRGTEVERQGLGPGDGVAGARSEQGQRLRCRGRDRGQGQGPG